MKQTYLMPNTQTEVLVESNAMQMTPQSQINPLTPPEVPTQPMFSGAPKKA